MVVGYAESPLGQQAPKDLGVEPRFMTPEAVRHRIVEGLHSREFVPCFQPQVCPMTGHVVGLEALARWNTPERGFLAPGLFIEVAEAHGLIDAIWRQVLDGTCAWVRHWRYRGLDLPVAVNISPRQLDDPALFLTMFDAVIAQHGIPHAAIELEITESAAMASSADTGDVMAALKARSVSIAIDDFGTGHSSLAVLSSLPVNKLKVDRSFVVDLDERKLTVVMAIVAMAAALDLRVVVEGVETREQLDVLRALGVGAIQGFFYERPVPGAHVAPMVSRPPWLARAGHHDAGSASPSN